MLCRDQSLYPFHKDPYYRNIAFVCLARTWIYSKQHRSSTSHYLCKSSRLILALTLTSNNKVTEYITSQSPGNGDLAIWTQNLLECYGHGPRDGWLPLLFLICTFLLQSRRGDISSHNTPVDGLEDLAPMGLFSPAKCGGRGQAPECGQHFWGKSVIKWKLFEPGLLVLWSVLQEISPEYSLEGLMLKLKL